MYSNDLDAYTDTPEPNRPVKKPKESDSERYWREKRDREVDDENTPTYDPWSGGYF